MRDNMGGDDRFDRAVNKFFLRLSEVFLSMRKQVEEKLKQLEGMDVTESKGTNTMGVATNCGAWYERAKTACGPIE